VSEAKVREEAEELEMQMERYVLDLHQALTEAESSFSFTLTPPPPGRHATVTLAYEKVQKDISVSGAHTHTGVVRGRGGATGRSLEGPLSERKRRGHRTEP